MHNETQCTVMA